MAAHAARLQAIRDRILDRVATTFKGAVKQVFTYSQIALDREIPPNSKGRNSRGLYTGETLTFPDKNTGVIDNTAASTDGYRYGYVVHEGRGALDAPTKLRGKVAYVWLTDPNIPRPTSKTEWQAARAANVVAWARHLPSVRSRPWRKDTVRTYGHLVGEFCTRSDAAWGINFFDAGA